MQRLFICKHGSETESVNNQEEEEEAVETIETSIRVCSAVFIQAARVFFDHSRVYPLVSVCLPLQTVLLI